MTWKHAGGAAGHCRKMLYNRFAEWVAAHREMMEREFEREYLALPSSVKGYVAAIAYGMTMDKPGLEAHIK